MGDPKKPKAGDKPVLCDECRKPVKQPEPLKRGHGPFLSADDLKELTQPKA